MFKLSNKQLLDLCAKVPAEQVAITAQGTFLNAPEYEKHKENKSVFLIADLKGAEKTQTDDAKVLKQAKAGKVVDKVITKVASAKQEKESIAKLDAKNSESEGDLDKLPPVTKPAEDKKPATEAKAAAPKKPTAKKPATRKPAKDSDSKEASTGG